MGTGAVFSGPYQPQPFAPSPFQQPMRGFGGVPLQQSPEDYARQAALYDERRSFMSPREIEFERQETQRVRDDMNRGRPAHLIEPSPRQSGTWVEQQPMNRSQPHVVPRPLVQVPAQLMNGFGEISSPFAPNSFFSAQPSPVLGYNNFNDLNTAANQGLGGMMFGGMGGFAPRPQPFGMGFSPFGFSQPSFGFGQPSMGGFPGKGGGGAFAPPPPTRSVGFSGKGGGGAFAPPPPTPSVGFSGKGGGGAYPSQPSPFGSTLGRGLGGMGFF